MFDKKFYGKTPDRVDKNESDGRIFYGFDDGEGRTEWYDENGDLDSCSETPYSYDDDDD